MKELVVATRNAGKLKEIRQLLEGHVEAIYSLDDFPELPDIIEDGVTFEENALKKAKLTALKLEKPVLADDSGLCVDVLGGKPGIFSARFAGNDAGDKENNKKLVAELAEIPPDRRSASFQCVIALYFPDGSHHTFKGELKGMIIDTEKGSSGFGYDPLFLVPEYDKTLAELSSDVKNRISHRGRALAQLKEFIRQERQS